MIRDKTLENLERKNDINSELIVCNRSLVSHLLEYLHASKIQH